MDIKNLFIRAAHGQKEAYGEIYRHFMPKIYRFVFFQIYDREQAADLTQETFLKVWKALPDFRPRSGTFQSFLYRVAKNLVIDYFRRKKEIPLHNLPETEYNDNPDEKIDSALDSRAVWLHLANLTEAEREIIILRYFEELSFSEIGDVTGMSEGNLRVRTHRILEKMRKEMRNG